MRIFYLFSFLFSFILSFKRNRLIVTHHKTGTMLARKLKLILSSTKVNLNPLSHPYYIATIGDGLEEIGLDKGWTNVVHLMRNPFSMIISSYYYHLVTEELWVHCKINNGWSNPLCPFKSKYNTIKNTISYIQNNLNNKLNLTGLNINHNNGNLNHNNNQNNNQNIQQNILKFPKTNGHTYQTYLNKLSLIQGVIVEMIRVNYHDIPSMIDDYLLMLRMQAYYTLPNMDSTQLSRTFVSICLESLTSVTSTGQIINSEEGLRRILHYLDITVTPKDMSIISEWVNHNTELHQTNQTNNSRSQLEAILRWYDKTEYNGLLHHFEKMIMCGNVGGLKSNNAITHNNNNNNNINNGHHHNPVIHSNHTTSENKETSS